MFKFLNCMIIKTKHDDHEENINQTYQTHQTDQYTQCNIHGNLHVDTRDCGVQCNLLTSTHNVIDISTCYGASKVNTHVFLRDKALCNMPFELHEDHNDKYIIMKGEKIYLRHIKGYYKFDQPWSFK